MITWANKKHFKESGCCGAGRATYVCRTHTYSKKGPGRCPICREDLECLGTRFRIGHMGQFDKVERKTKNLQGQRKIVTVGARRRNMEKR